MDLATKTYEQEIDEAIRAGRKALVALKQAEGFLSSARGWGIFDMLGGGLISSLIKHSKLHDAQHCLENAREELQNFTKELRDVSRYISFNVEFDGLSKFFDIFYDGFLVDAIIQSRIKEARSSVQSTIRQVEQTLAGLENM